jgi:hypothetical protein
MKFYKGICSATSVLFVFLALRLLLTPVAFAASMGLEPSVATSVLLRRAAMFMVGLAVLTFYARSLQDLQARRCICLSASVTLLGLACMGTYERLMGTVNASIFIAIGIESVLGLAFLMVLLRRPDKA